MLAAELIAQGVLLLVALALSALVTVRTGSVVKGTLYLYGFSVLWVLLFAIVVPWVVSFVIEADERDIAHMFPTQIGLLPMLAFGWIPALVFASLVNLVAVLAEGRIFRQGRRRSVADFAAGPAGQSLPPALAPTDDKSYPRGVGALLSIFLPGSAHFLMGKRWSGLRWYLVVTGCWYLAIGLLATPGRWGLAGTAVAATAALLLHLAVLRQSYRPVPRMRLRRWLALFAIMICLGVANKFVTRLGVRPFQITGRSMVPTLYGFHSQEIRDGDILKAQFLGGLIGGRHYVHWRAAVSGKFEGPVYLHGAPSLRGYRVGTDARTLPASARLRVEPGDYVSAGQLVYSGFVVTQDCVLVDKVSYRFRAPRRGEIVVFRTDGIQHLTAGEFYVKRVVGLPGERVQIDPPYLVIDGQRVTEPAIFDRMASQQDGYSGYQLAENPERRMFLDTTESEVVLGEDEYFVLGDNPKSAYDSRMWGPVPRENIIGRATRIYWPLDRLNALERKW